MGSGGTSSGRKAAVPEADHSPPSSAEVKVVWSFTSSSSCIFMSWCLVKHRDSFACILLFCKWRDESHLLYKVRCSNCLNTLTKERGCCGYVVFTAKLCILGRGR
jgi:hypothetical protein